MPSRGVILMRLKQASLFLRVKGILDIDCAEAVVEFFWEVANTLAETKVEADTMPKVYSEDSVIRWI